MNRDVNGLDNGAFSSSVLAWKRWQLGRYLFSRRNKRKAEQSVVIMARPRRTVFCTTGVRWRRVEAVAVLAVVVQEDGSARHNDCLLADTMTRGTEDPLLGPASQHGREEERRGERSTCVATRTRLSRGKQRRQHLLCAQIQIPTLTYIFLRGLAIITTLCLALRLFFRLNKERQSCYCFQVNAERINHSAA